MTKIERRRATVKLHHGNYEQDLADKQAEFEAALAAEETGSTRRKGTKSKAAALAVEWEKLKAEAAASAVEVTVWAISNTEWSTLADEHPPREDDAGDKARGVNMKTFPGPLLRASLVDPATEGMTSVHDKVAVGTVTLAEMDLSRVHYVKLENAAWSINVGDDALPKYSLVSLLKQARDPDSKPRSEPE